MVFPCVGVSGYPVRTECGHACGGQDLQTHFLYSSVLPISCLLPVHVLCKMYTVERSDTHTRQSTQRSQRVSRRSSGSTDTPTRARGPSPLTVTRPAAPCTEHMTAVSPRPAPPRPTPSRRSLHALAPLICISVNTPLGSWFLRSLSRVYEHTPS